MKYPPLIQWFSNLYKAAQFFHKRDITQNSKLSEVSVEPLRLRQSALLRHNCGSPKFVEILVHGEEKPLLQ